MAIFKYDKAREAAQSSSTPTGGGGGVSGNYLPASRTEDGYQVSEDTQFVKQLSLVTEDGAKVATIGIDANGRFYFDRGIVSAEDMVAYGVNGERIATVQELIAEQIVANPSGVAVTTITKLGINGVVYNIEGGGSPSGGIIWGGTTGNGNAVTSINYDSSSNTLSADKGATFLTEHQSLANYATTAYVNSAVAGITKSSIGLGNVDNTSDANKTVYSSGRVRIFNHNENDIWYPVVWSNSNNGNSDVDTQLFKSNSNFMYNPHKKTFRIGRIESLNSQSSIILDDNYLVIGYDCVSNGIDTYLDGNNIHFRCSSDWTEALTIASNGNVGVGKNSPSVKLDVAGVVRSNYTYFLDKDGVDNAGWVGRGSSGNNHITLYADSGNNVQVTSATGSVILSANSKKVTITNGNLVSEGDVTAYSDARLKSDIKDLEYRGSLSPKTYIKDGKKSIGFVAQEVRKLYPELVIGEEKEDEYLSLNYGAITAVLAAENKELKKTVESLEERIAKLEALLMKGGEA